jgi:shikimate 5-dehydrogenase
MTRRVALIGQPLRRRHSPLTPAAAFAAAGIHGRYELREIGPEDAPGFVEAARSGDWYGFKSFRWPSTNRA